MQTEYVIVRGDYTRAGEASADIKRRLRQLGVSTELLRRVAVASYELELNLVIHSDGGELQLEVDNECVKLTSHDRGPGIKDVALAMRAGFSTANDEARSLGFGAGMGLPNMKRNADVFRIDSQVGRGTDIQMLFELS